MQYYPAPKYKNVIDLIFTAVFFVKKQTQESQSSLLAERVRE
jgi:hypothetical protein